MKNKHMTFLWLLLAVLLGIEAYMLWRPSGKTNYTPATFRHLHTDIEHPDTFIGYWDRGMLYLQVTSYNEDDSADEDNR